jgi:hypothetical protein
VLAEVVSVVQDLTGKHQRRFRASYVAEQAGVPLDAARRNLVKLAEERGP